MVDPTPWTTEQCLIIGHQTRLSEWVTPLILCQLIITTWLLMQLRRSGYEYDGKYWGVVVLQGLIVIAYLVARWGV
jgi:hypothetical protein